MKRCLSCASEFDQPLWECPSCAWRPARLDGRLAFAPELAQENSGFDAQYFRRLAEIEQNHFWFEARNRLVVWALRKYFPEAKHILEIGCGTGFVLSEISRSFPNLWRAGSEIFSEGLQFASRRLPDVDLFQMDARQIPFTSEFDVIGAFDVLEHIEEDFEVLRQMYRALKPGGGIIVTVPQHRWLWSAIDEYACHKRRYTRRELIERIQRAGFRPMRTTSFVTFLLPAMLISRYRYRRHPERIADEAELMVGRLLNNLLLRILSAERALIARGVSLPAGGSRLLVARKRP